MPRIYTSTPTDIPGLLVDPEDERLIRNRRYYVHWKGYVVTCRKVNGKQTFFQLHREVLNPPPGAIVDHINGNKLDNRKCNLRVVTQSENMQNLRKKNPGASGYRNVMLVGGKHWQVRIRKPGGKFYYKMGFPSAEAAAQHAEEMRRKLLPGYSLENREFGT
jgi:hypothetical protein